MQDDASSATPGALKNMVPCPTCRRMTLYCTGNRWRPFCSERCRMIDLGAWAQEDYRMAAPPDAQDLAE